MAQRIVLLSGPIGVGKSTLTDSLEKTYQARIIKTRELLDLEARFRFQSVKTREEYQKLGETLDRETGGLWVSNALKELLEREKADLVIVDSVRIQKQVDAIREVHGFAVFHLHLTAFENDLRKRFEQRTIKFQEAPSFDSARQNATEQGVRLLERKADAVVNTSFCNPEDVFVRVSTHLRLYSRDYSPTVDVLVGGQFGSEGKGNVASYLAREYDILIRGGGPNAGHKVYENPAPYTHHLLPCGSRSTKAKLIIAPGAVISVSGLLREAHESGIGSERLSIDPQVMVITPADIEAEKQLIKMIGSTGQGVGAASARRIMSRGDSILLARDYVELKPFIRETAEILESAYRQGSRILLEGTQGAGLSLFHGFYPHVTSRDTSVAACLSEAGIPPKRVHKVIMTCRTYPIRVQDGAEGTSGKLSRELDWQDVADRSLISVTVLRKAEITSTTKRPRRVAEFDWVQLRKAALLNGPTDIALTFVDYIDGKNKDARRFEQLTEKTIQFIEEVENVAAAPVSLVSTRFGFRSIIDRRNW
jgi:adenylosuccinate synthase